MRSTRVSRIRLWEGHSEAYEKVRGWANKKRQERQHRGASEDARKRQQQFQVDGEEHLYGGSAASEDSSTPAAPSNAPWPESEDPAPAVPPVPSGSPWRQNWIRDNPALSSCFRNVPAAFEFTRFALELGKEALWYYTKSHHPRLCERLSRHGPNMIAASYTELESSTRDFTLADEAGIARELIQLPRLRNFVAHPTGWVTELSVYDGYAEIAEDLMVKVGDEGRLQRLWGAREVMRLEAERMLSEVKDRELLSELQGSYVQNDGVWESRHIKLFRYLLKSAEEWRHNPRIVDPVACRVAERWGELNPWEPWRAVEGGSDWAE
jgi:hypothetical protein